MKPADSTTGPSRSRTPPPPGPEGKSAPDWGGPHWLLAIAAVAAAAGLLLLAYHWVGSPPIEVFLERGSLEAFLERQGARAPLVFLLLQVIQVVLAPIPGHLLGVVSGMLFGLWWGTLYTSLGVGVGSAIVLILARLVGRPLVERLAPASGLARVDRWAAHRGPLFFFLVFMLPFLPDDLACLALGLSGLPLVPMFLVILIARLPGHFLAAWVGANATGLPLIGWILITLFAVAGTMVYWRHRRQIEHWLLARVEGVEKRR